MNKIKRLALALAGLTLAVTAVGAPAAASSHPAQIAIIQGMTGVRVDLCLDKKPIRSNVRYGWKTFRVLDPGSYTLKLYKHDPRKCKGVKIAQKSFDLVEHGDLSMVLAKGTPVVQCVPVRRAELDMVFEPLDEAAQARLGETQKQVITPEGAYRRQFRAKKT